VNLATASARYCDNVGTFSRRNCADLIRKTEQISGVDRGCDQCALRPHPVCDHATQAASLAWVFAIPGRLRLNFVRPPLHVVTGRPIVRSSAASR
jgi:hypothetical protein